MNEDIAAFVAPLTLILGGGLLALGALSFLGVDYFESKFKSRVAFAIGLAFLVATELIFVTSSSSGRYFAGLKVDVTDCELDGESKLPEERHKNSRVLHDYIVGCMQRLGYEWNADHDHCKEAQIATNSFCYLPTRPMARAIVRFQTTFE
ncbi:hypothetical protein [Methylosinus sp. Sm6]|uniref:hypothetical protein n=1 Tax=Methylosinus sp. Sm6 TaxID=2866948 RepID=UPI001C99240A|nr:hypothetical protein [Methylosinus sp. Sm6]MBY6240116.1 hypothetical protein [Methylosinus sp. Sm6]